MSAICLDKLIFFKIRRNRKTRRPPGVHVASRGGDRAVTVAVKVMPTLASVLDCAFLHMASIVYTVVSESLVQPTAWAQTGSWTTTSVASNPRLVFYLKPKVRCV